MDANNNLLGQGEGEGNQPFDLDNEERYFEDWFYMRRVPPPDSYDKYLAAKGLPLNTIPTPVEPYMSDEYREWRQLGPKQQKQHHLNHEISTGDYPSFGLHYVWPKEQNEPTYGSMYGPLTIDQLYPDSQDYGPSFDAEPFDNTQRFVEILGTYGYDLGNNVTKGADDLEFDHQIWVVTKRDTEPGQYELQDGQQYACKVVASKYFYDDDPNDPKMTSNFMTKMERESNVLRYIRHPNIIRVLDVFGIQDEITGFYVFLFSVMDMMDGSLDRLANAFPHNERVFDFPHELVTSVTIQMIKAINFLHNQVDRWVVVHQAIKYENILFTRQGDPRHYFKLGDFEDCICYDRSKIEEGTIFDLHDPEVIPYVTICSSDEYWEARDPNVYFNNLRTMPNDVFSVGGLGCFLLSGFDETEQIDYLKEKIEWMHREDLTHHPNYHLYELLRLMTEIDAQIRITIEEVVNHDSFLLLDQSPNLFMF